MNIFYDFSQVRLFALVPLCIYFLACASTRSAPTQTDFLEPEVGYTGALIGAEIERITPLPEEGIVEIVISVPGAVEKIHSVSLVDKKGKKIQTAKPFEFNKNADGQPDGITIYLHKKRILPFRLKFNAQE